MAAQLGVGTVSPTLLPQGQVPGGHGKHHLPSSNYMDCHTCSLFDLKCTKWCNQKLIMFWEKLPPATQAGDCESVAVKSLCVINWNHSQ